jgi:ribosomal-protein-alanine N-acetyltransferase
MDECTSDSSSFPGVQLEITAMSQADAVAIAAWHYPPPYSFYDWTADVEDAALLLDEQSREGRFFSALDVNGELAGFFEFQVKGDDVIIGLGLRPDLTGRGLGHAFLEAGIEFARETFAPAQFRLSVASFNKRAIKVYERAGFTTTRAFDHETNGGIHPFLEMTRLAYSVTRVPPKTQV